MSTNHTIPIIEAEKFISLFNKLGECRKKNHFLYFSNWTPTDPFFPKYTWQWNFTINEYNQIKKLITDNASILKEIAFHQDFRCCKLIQLYVSEWYKREYNGNSGTGNPLKNINANITAKDICKRIGIDEDSVYTSQNISSVPQPEWLSTLYVDGGLPLHYLQIKPSSLRASIIRILDGDNVDLAELCHNQVINQSYYGHFTGDHTRSSIYDFVQDVIINGAIHIEGFDDFERIVRETKLQRFHPKFQFECIMIEKDDIWYRTLKLNFERGSKKYFDYARVKSWCPELDEITNSAWIDISVFTTSRPNIPALFLKAANNYQGQFFIPDNRINEDIILDGRDTIDRIELRFEGISGTYKLPSNEYYCDDLTRIQLDEIQSGLWKRHYPWSGLHSAVFFMDQPDDFDDNYSELEGRYEIVDSIYYDEEITVFHDLMMHKVDIIGTLQFTDGIIYHTSAKFCIEPTNISCRSIRFPSNFSFILKTPNGEHSALLLILNNSQPEEGYKLLFRGEEVSNFTVEGFDSNQERPYRTFLNVSYMDQTFPIGDAIIIPESPKGPKFITLGKLINHEIFVKCLDGKTETLRLTNTPEDIFEYELKLPDGCSIILPLYPPYKTYDILQRKPRLLLNSFNYDTNDDSFFDLISRPSKNNSLIFFIRPTRADSHCFYIRKRKRRGDPERYQFRGFFLRKPLTKRGSPELFRFLVNPNFVLASNVRVHDKLDCEIDPITGYYKFTTDSVNKIIRLRRESLKIFQDNIIHLQRFTIAIIENNNLIITQIP